MLPRLLPIKTLAYRVTSTKPASLSLTNRLAGIALQQARHASILASLANNKGAVRQVRRVGRGPSSGRGKTSGRGHKGRKARGNVKPWFQGGQTPLIRKLGSKGFENKRAPRMTEVNLDSLQQWIDHGRIDATKPITPREMILSKLTSSVKDGIKILARGTLRQPVQLSVSRASAAAIAAIEAAGGKVVTRYYTKMSMNRLARGESIHTDEPLPVGSHHVTKVLKASRKTGFKYRLPDATSRRDIEYYRDPAHRGYLSHQLKPGESPSLYWDVPAEKKAGGAVRKNMSKDAKVQTMW
ncbi:hypothetical protein L249_2499 [Ophiocordyceps polyrhachis-furcata BCC 54312]|uniref:Large ribosomal subunit protein uL15/eL18 domain-containing protein n=1 Tax=Ophiocordyceps polyrhachis-furcata BCC 54312 TaxID=1330021 RepID=A0A367LQL5_9HYPO|nr:hypothetical protein L249_2499 [Ophiocordyceps polyrhachis-furcata BCC 54312]